MTVIIGVNLSERSLLAGDTRVTYKDDDELYIRHDNMQKVENIGGTPTITAACAGNANFAKYILNQLRNNPAINHGISYFKNNAKDCIGIIAHDYFNIEGYEDAQVTIIFSGSDVNIKKKVHGEQVIKLADAYTGGKGVIKVSHALQEAFKPGEKITGVEKELKINNTNLFAVEVTPSRLDITPCGWGEFLMYGQKGIVREDIDSKVIADLEFSPYVHDNGSGVGNDLSLMTAFITSQAEKYNLNAVGGSVLVFENTHEGKARPLSGKVFVADKDGSGPIREVSSIDALEESKIYREKNGTLYKLRPISTYKDNALGQMYL